MSKNLDGLVFKIFRGVKFGIFEIQYLTPNHGAKIRKNEIDEDLSYGNFWELLG